jgi:hypothetical protein
VQRRPLPNGSALTGLIANARQGFLATEHGHHVKDRRGNGLSGKGCAQRLGNSAELGAGRLGKAAYGFF